MNVLHEALLVELEEDGYLKTPEIREAFRAIDRAYFVPDEYKNEAYVNAPLPIGHGQTISQPLTVAFMLELLKPRFGQTILDVGSGSGWTSALLSYVVSGGISDFAKKKNLFGETSGKIYALERIAELKKMSEENLEKYGFLKGGIAEVILGDGSKGYKKGAPFDKILAGAAAQGDVPETWKNQLAIGGRIVAPIGNKIVVIDKYGKKDYTKQEYYGFSFVPLIQGK